MWQKGTETRFPVPSLTDGWRVRHDTRSSECLCWFRAAVRGPIWRTFVHLQPVSLWKPQSADTSPVSAHDILVKGWNASNEAITLYGHLSSDGVQWRAGTEVHLRWIYLKVTPTLVCCTEEGATAYVCMFIPFHCPGRLNALFWPFFNSPFHNSQLLLQAEIATTGNYSWRTLRAGFSELLLASIPSRIWDLMHERWYFSFHSTALGLCPVYFLFGVAKVLCWLPWQFIPSQTHLNYPKDNMLNAQCRCLVPHISAALGSFFNIHKILCLFYIEALFC